MPNTFIDNRDRWLQMSEIDYLGQFVKAWLAFNAWYRSAYSETQDRHIIDEIKWLPNPISSLFRPLLTHTSEDAEQFREEIGRLHHRLERYQIFSGKGPDKTIIKMSKIVVRTEPPSPPSEVVYRKYRCRVERVDAGRVSCVVLMPSGAAILNWPPRRFDPDLLDNDAAFASLPQSVRRAFRAHYLLANPRVVRNLEDGDADPIQCGTQSFRCGPDFLFAGVVEILYLLRCCLFHGELTPSSHVAECYEPAYRILRRFLLSINAA